MDKLDRIRMNPEVMRCKPTIRGMRVTVGRIVGEIGAGITPEELLADYPYIECEDVSQALAYAALHPDLHRGSKYDWVFPPCHSRKAGISVGGAGQEKQRFPRARE
jgi:uncharacterized protein (DUF433 family)